MSNIQNIKHTLYRERKRERERDGRLCHSFAMHAAKAGHLLNDYRIKLTKVVGDVVASS